MMNWITPASAIISMTATLLVIIIHLRTIRTTGPNAEKKAWQKDTHEKVGSNAQRLKQIEEEIGRLWEIDRVGFTALVNILNNLCNCENNQNIEAMYEIMKEVNDFLIKTSKNEVVDITNNTIEICKFGRLT